MMRTLALILTVLTGFSGLVYEVAWQRYLATLLGSHSEATAAVLGIFLGGLSLGYSLFGTLTRRVVARADAAGRPPRLLLVYGCLELGVGVYALVFPWLFRGVRVLSYAIPHGPAGAGFAMDVLLCALLIGPAAVLMGGTIPILTQALARSLEDATRFHALVYATNTVGAFAGALAAGFHLVPRLGLEAVMLAMGGINLAAGAIFVLLGLRGRAVASLEQGNEESALRVEGFRVYALVALLTGFATMTIQTTIIRLGASAFGSSQFTFSMVVAVFVAAIALGSFLVSTFTRIPTRFVVLNQWGIALAFLALYPVLDQAPYWVHVIRTLFRDSDAAFLAYHLLGFLLVLTVIGLPVLFSGASLPLLFHHMRREVGHLGDLAGYLYSWNTVGSLLGALVGGYALFFWLDLDQVFRVAVASLAIAAMLLSIRALAWRPVAALALAPALLALALLPRWDPELQTWNLLRMREPTPGVYSGPEAFLASRQAATAPHIETIAHVDDPTTSVIVQEWTYSDQSRSRSLITNGKGDGDTRSSYREYALLAALPAIMAEKAERAFLIGWGIGVTAGELASLDEMQRVDVAEISRGVTEFAPLFDTPFVQASKSPKIHVIHSDAYRALMRSDESYDLIVSQPSHVWVSGVELLFSREFLEAARSKLNPGGVHCQWLQLYEIDDDAIALVLRTYAEVFDHVSAWYADGHSLVLLGFESPDRAADPDRLAERLARPDLRAVLTRAGVKNAPGLLAHEYWPLGVLHAADLRGPVNTILHPRLGEAASRAFFRGDSGQLPFTGWGPPARVGAEHSLLRGWAQRSGGRLSDEQRAQLIGEACRLRVVNCETLLAQWLSEGPDSAIFDELFRRVTSLPQSIGAARVGELAALYGAAPEAGGHAVDAERALRASGDFVEFYQHGAPFGEAGLTAIWEECRGPGEECREGARRARELIETGKE
ncbi:MAG: fused MFS/spermidine synthase [Deltaproteobacteria bacterium]|nr:fused MFS/spermidine synthase [Deltaproteobacteria bacterium]